MNSDRNVLNKNDEEETVAIIDATVTLATHVLDGLGLSDDDLDSLCDVVVNENEAPQVSNQFSDACASRDGGGR